MPWEKGVWSPQSEGTRASSSTTSKLDGDTITVLYTVKLLLTTFTEDNIVRFLSSVEYLIKKKQLRGLKKIKGAIIEEVKACPNPAMREICHYLYDGEVDLPKNLPESQFKLIEYNCKHLEKAYDTLVDNKFAV